ncbi:MAG: glyoxalase [Bacteroidetes bacterium GWE2_29_8]|nr:MAG: glyoxalase [Bacteroidetes bacterium GWE2_29_8]
MKFICPLIVVEDIQRSRNFYENILEQKIKFDFGENVTFHGDFAIHLGSHYKGLIDEKEIKHGGNNFELYFEFDDVMQIESRLKENGVVFIHHTREQPWRQNVLRFYDPDENIIEVGESLEHLAYRLHKEGMAISEISKTIYMSNDFIEEAVKKY